MSDLSIEVKSKRVTVSDCEQELLTEHHWFLSSGDRYAVTRHHGGYLYLSRLVAERAISRPLESGEIIYHRNRDGLDNTRDNLRVSTKATERKRRTRACASCGSPFHSYERTRRFCSAECGNSARRQERRESPNAIQAATGEWIKVSAEDVQYLRDFSWYINSNGYAMYKTSTVKLRMHRVVLERVLGRALAAAEVPDHVNHDPLDNRRSNLRLASVAQNTASSRRRTGSSGYRYVERHHSGKWSARVQKLHIILTDDKQEAAWMADQFAIALYDEFAVTNFEYV